MSNNVIIIVMESLGYYRAYLNSLAPQYRLTELFDVAKDGTTFHKCISVSNSSWMSTASLIMGNDVCYQHNAAYDWGYKFDQSTVCNTWSDSLFHILRDNGYKIASFTSPAGKETGYRLFLFDLVDSKKTRIDSMLGSQDNKFYETRKAHYDGLVDYIKANKENKFAVLSWGYLDHIVVGGNNSSTTTKGPIARLSCFKETTANIANVIQVLKKENLYDKTDIYIVGDHGDSFYYTRGLTGEKSLQHGTLPMHITTHVPLIVKSSYIPKGDRYDLVSNIDIHSTILNSLGIKRNDKEPLLKNLSSLDLKTQNGREYVLSRNKFINQKNPDLGLPAGVAITNSEYNYMITKNKKYLFYHLLDILNLNNIFEGIAEKSNNTHYRFWYHDLFMDKIKKAVVPWFEKTVKELSDKGHIDITRL